MYIPQIETRRNQIENELAELATELDDLNDLEMRLEDIVEEITETVRFTITDIIECETSDALHGIELDDSLAGDIFEAIKEEVESNL